MRRFRFAPQRDQSSASRNLDISCGLRRPSRFEICATLRWPPSQTADGRLSVKARAEATAEFCQLPGIQPHRSWLEGRIDAAGRFGFQGWPLSDGRSVGRLLTTKEKPKTSSVTVETSLAFADFEVRRSSHTVLRTQDCACFPQSCSEWHFVRWQFAVAVCSGPFHAPPHRTTISNRV